MRAAVGLLGVVVALQVPVQTQVRDPRTFRSAVEVTSVTVTVRDADGRLVTDLPKERFEIYEDGDRQTLSHFTSERVPISVAVALDASDSMLGRRMDDARVAVRRFLDEQIDPTDEFLLMAFNHEPKVLTPWSGDRGLAGRLLASITPTGGTAVYDAILAAVPLFAARTRQRAAVLVISDGADTASDATLRDVRAALIRSYAQGRTDDEAFSAALGLDMRAFGAAWLADLKAKPPTRYGPQPAVPGPVPSAWAVQTESSSTPSTAGGGGAASAAPGTSAVPGLTAPSDGGGGGPRVVLIIVALGAGAAIAILVARRRRQANRKTP